MNCLEEEVVDMAVLEEEVEGEAETLTNPW
jgi:hypothetical protein